MGNSYLLIADLKGGRCRTTIEVRLLRFWEDISFKKGSERMGVDILPLDPKVIPANIYQSIFSLMNIFEIYNLRFNNHLL